MRQKCEDEALLQVSAPYRRAMPRLPKDFAVRSVEIISKDPVPTRTSPRTSAPRDFRAKVTLEDSPLLIQLWAEVGPGGQAQVRSLEVSTTDGSAVTTSALRKVLVDQILKAALAEVTGPATPRHDVHPHAIEVAGPGPFGEPGPVVYVNPEPLAGREARQEDRTLEAAKIYTAAVAAGSRAPGQAVATEMGYSRSQAARYIRLARERGWLPNATQEEEA